jgi:hypothetical protein
MALAALKGHTIDSISLQMTAAPLGQLPDRITFNKQVFDDEFLERCCDDLLFDCISKTISDTTFAEPSVPGELMQFTRWNIYDHRGFRRDAHDYGRKDGVIAGGDLCIVWEDRLVGNGSIVGLSRAPKNPGAIS